MSFIVWLQDIGFNVYRQIIILIKVILDMLGLTMAVELFMKAILSIYTFSCRIKSDNKTSLLVIKFFC